MTEEQEAGLDRAAEVLVKLAIRLVQKARSSRPLRQVLNGVSQEMTNGTLRQCLGVLWDRLTPDQKAKVRTATGGATHVGPSA